MTLEEIGLLNKAWIKAWDASKALEDANGGMSKPVEYWTKVHLAWVIQDKIRDKLKAAQAQYVEENLDKLIKEFI